MICNANRNAQKLSSHYKAQRNHIKIEANNTYLHEILKCCVCKVLKNKNHSFVTEARFTSFLRADVYDLTEDVVYEIVHTESDESIEYKMLGYPVREIIVIRTKDYKDLKLSDIEKKLEKVIYF